MQLGKRKGKERCAAPVGVGDSGMRNEVGQSAQRDDPGASALAGPAATAAFQLGPLDGQNVSPLGFGE